MHRQIIVAGSSTSGKSTFSRELIKRYQLQHIQIDPIIEAFEEVFPDLGITHHANSIERHLIVCDKFGPFISRMIDGLKHDDFVIEGFRMPIEALYEKYGKTHQFFVFGYPSATAKDKTAQCRQFDITNWTNEMTDDDLEDIFEFLIEESKREEEICKRLNISFFDTSRDYHKKISDALKIVI